ncbi:segregation/condensation protein A [Streptomyces lateritius]|uniref:segregation/condensation protein A n=1 Tax=Streptomyces lateritius TaxID=67313 RepID=UPI0021AB7839|nr:segregation/condensation protein A [Streptomyces lateritius]
MHHASDETSRPPRRRVLGRGPGAEAGDGPEAGATGPDPGPPVDRGPGPEADGRHEQEDGREDGAGDAGGRADVGPGEDGGGASPAADGRTETLGTSRTVGPGEAPGTAETVGTAETAGSVDTAEDPRAAGTAEGAPPDAGGGRFTVRLSNFEGPFDLLLQLITKHKLDVTEVALSQVTDEFMAHLRALGPDGDLDQTTEFLVVAATLLDLKAARLLPAAEVEDEADLALLEARDLLFARLLQYRAYKRIAAIFEECWETEGRRHPRTVGLEPHHAELLPEVVISIGAEGFARLAVKAMQPKPEPQVYVDHIHAPLVSVREQADVVVALLRERGTALFRELIEDVGDDTLTVVARFLALLELYREKAVALDQETALGDLTVSWTGGDGETRVTDEFDQVPERETEAPR